MTRQDLGVQIVEGLSARQRPSALILVPTRELAQQVADEIRLIAGAKRLGVAAVYGGAGVGLQVRKANRADIVVGTPDRVLDLLRRRLLRLNQVAVCVVDEAEKMVTMGLQSEVDTILSVLPEHRETMVF